LLAGLVAGEGDRRSLLTVMHGMAIGAQSLDRPLAKGWQRY
jgi:hypothetical protein